MEQRRVVVTGIGTINPIGNNIEEYFRNLEAGVSGADTITAFNPEKFPSRIACEVKNFDPALYFDRKEARKYDRFSQFAVVAATEAIEDAVINSQINGIENTTFYAGDMKDVLSDEFVERNGRPDVIILDPPRAGVDERVLEVIKRAAPERMVYVSCNPSTQARDLAILNDMYEILAVQPVDMFPHTHHVENVVKLRKR